MPALLSPCQACDEYHRLTTIQRLRLFQQVCAAVHFLHQNTLVHRDLKPANIQVSTRGIPKLLDFGIAKLTHRDGGSPELTLADQRFMTLEYASPEQVRGEIITTASDVYALGVILYELLSGHQPRESGDRSEQELERAIGSDEDPMRPSDAIGKRVLVRRRGVLTELTPKAISSVRGASPDQLARQLRGDLDNIILKAMRREPGHRYVSAEQLAADIERYLRNESTLAAPPSFAYHAMKFIRRNKVACVVLFALLLGLGGSITGVVLASRSRDRALLAEQQTQKQAGQLRRAVYVREMTLASLDLRGGAIGSGKRRLREAPSDLRDWEWQYLSAACEDSVHVCQGHHGWVMAVAASPDGRLGASAGIDMTVRIWDTRTGACLNTLSTHQAEILNIALSPDGSHLVSSSADGCLRLWDLHNQPVPVASMILDGPVLWSTFSPNGHRFVSTGADRTVRLSDSETGDDILTFHEHRTTVTSAAFSPDGRMLVSAGQDRFIVFRDTVPYPQVLVARRQHQDQIEVASRLITGLRNLLGDWERVAEAIRIDHSLPPAIQREALNRVLARGHSRSPVTADWETSFFSWPPTHDLQEMTNRWNVARNGPDVVRCQRRIIDFNWDKHTPAPGLPLTSFGMVATATLATPAGRHLVETAADDGVRVSIDGRRIIDDWTPHAVTVKRIEIELTEGPHQVQIEYFQLDGAARLRLLMEPVRPPTPGSRAASSMPSPSSSRPTSRPCEPPTAIDEEAAEPPDDAARLPFGS
ncbi:MAG: protein kinase [Phycisphaerae bacterium]|nr:protein kinase [Phycisphaerae bacterium]